MGKLARYNLLKDNRSAILRASTGNSLKFWIRTSDLSAITINFQSIAETATGTINANTITASADISTKIFAGNQIRIGGSDLYIVANVATTEITTEKPLVANYSADAIEIARVPQVSDNSGNDNHAIQSTAIDQGTLFFNHVNGRSCVKFDGADQHMDMTSDISLAGEFTMFLVANNEETASTRALLGSGTTNNKVATISPGKAFVRIIPAGSGDSTQDYLVEGETGIQTIQRDSDSKVDMSFNGAAFTRLYSDVAQVDTSVWNKIAVDDGTFNWQGSVCEIAIFNKKLDASELNDVLSELALEWGVALV